VVVAGIVVRRLADAKNEMKSVEISVPANHRGAEIDQAYKFLKNRLESETNRNPTR